MAGAANPPIRSVPGRRSAFLSIAGLMVLIAAGSAAVLNALYQQDIENTRQRLSAFARSDAHLIGQMIRLHISHGDDLEHAITDMLSVITAETSALRGYRATGELVLGRLQGDQISYLLMDSQQGSKSVINLVCLNRLAEPMQRALAGEAGSLIGCDYRGQQVLAAYEPIDVGDIPLGLVVEIDVAELQAPYLWGGAVMALAVLALGSGAFLALRWIDGYHISGQTLLHDLNADLEERVYQRTRELEKSNEALQKLSAVKDQFIANMSHELKTPIANLGLRQHSLRRHPEALDRHLEVMERETKRLEHIIDNLLRLARLDQNHEELCADTLVLNDLVRDHIHDRQSMADAHQIELESQLEEGLPAVTADSGLIEQVLGILLTNAIHYTPPAGRVMVRTASRQMDGKWWAGFCVDDSGPGLQADEQEKIFDRFFRGHASRLTQKPGTGLGLAIASEIVQRHHGRIEAANRQPPDQGALFSVWLPCEEKRHGKYSSGG